MKSRRHRAINRTIAKTVAKRRKEFIEQMDNSEQFIRVTEGVLGEELLPFQKAVLRSALRNGLGVPRGKLTTATVL